MLKTGKSIFIYLNLTNQGYLVFEGENYPPEVFNGIGKIERKRGKMYRC
jgi:hypothetical protein